MLTYNPYELEEMLESDELFESDESDESDEARRRRRPPVRTARRGNAVPQRPAQGFATRAELTATANRLDARIATNSTAIKTVEGRTATLSTDYGKLRTDVNRLQGGINDVRNMAMLMPLLTTQTTRKPGTALGEIKADDKVLVDTGDNMSRLLPLLLFSGSFGSSSGGQSASGGGGMFGGDNSGIMMIALVMAMSDKNK
jgi:hypothetical protein